MNSSIGPHILPDGELRHPSLGGRFKAGASIRNPDLTFSGSLRLALLIACLTFAGNSSAITTDTVSRGGITWTFSTPQTVGQFANGDWWVVGPVTLTAISPAWDGVRHGTMINPMASDTDHGFDTRLSNTTFKASLNIADDLPLTVPINSSIVSVGSFEIEDTVSPSKLRTIAILTVLPEEPAPGAFRPPYAGGNKSIPGYLSDVDYTAFRCLPPLSHAPTKAEVEGNGLEFPILDILKNWENSELKVQASGINLHYGRQLAYKSADVALWLNLDLPRMEKESVMIKAVQRGIDVYGLARYAGMEWQRNGGHNNGRKIYLAVAARALNHPGMIEWCDAARHFVFQEDQQHFHLTQSDIDQPPTSDGIWYRQEMLGMPEWASNPIDAVYRTQLSSEWGKPYRTVTGGPNTGTMLAAHLMGARPIWNHEVFFDYIEERYWPREQGGRSDNLNKIYRFPAEMWDAYHSSPILKDTTPPDSPVGVSSSGITSTSFELQWQASADNLGVMGYRVRLDGTEILSVKGTTTPVSNLTPETSHTIEVIAYDAAGNESAPSQVLEVTTGAP